MDRVIEERDVDTYFDEQVQLAQRCHDLGIDLCYAHRDVEEALVQLKRAIALRESLLGKYHNDTALSYFRMASVLREEKKDYSQALVFARREIRITLDVLGDRDAPLHAFDQRWLQERVQWFNEVVECLGRCSPKDPTKYCSQLLQSLELERTGDRHRRAGEWEVAITQYNNALALESSAYPRNELEIADLQAKVGDCYYSLGDHEAAMEEYRCAQLTYAAEFGTSHATVAGILRKEGAFNLNVKKDYDAALASYAKVYSLYEEILGPRHPSSVEALHCIRVVTVREMEELRRQERQRQRHTSKQAGRRSRAQKTTSE